MAGIAGFITANHVDAPSRLSAALSALCHHPTFESVSCVDQGGLQLGAVQRPNTPARVCHLDQAGLTVIVYGDPLEKTGSWRVAMPNDVAQRVLDGGVGRLADYDGSYLIAVADRERGRVEIVNDRMGSIPLVYASCNGEAAFAPEAKALFKMLDLQPRLDQTAAIAYMNCGYPIAGRTQFEGVQLLAPATILTLDLKSRAFTSRRYWQMRFEPQNRLSEQDAAHGLFEVMLEAQHAALIDSPATVQLLLTGGYDSRIILGLSKRLGRTLDKALTWGVSDDIRESDVDVAQRLARIANVPFQFLPYDADALPLHASDWTFISELSSDNAGNFIVDPSFLSSEAGAADVVLIGDQMVGPSGLPLDRADAAVAITKVPRDGLMPAFRAIMRQEAAADAGGTFRGLLGEVAESFPSDHPKDVQDNFYFHLYVHRWLLGHSYFREPMVTVRRPLLSNLVLDYTSTLPRWLRVDKRALMAALKLKLPEMTAIQPASAPSIVDWSYAMRADSGVRGLMLEYLAWERLSATPIGDLLDRPAVEALVHAFFSQPVAPMSRAPSKQGKALKLRQALSTVPALGRLARRAEPMLKQLLGWSPGLSPQVILWRLASLSMLQSLVQDRRFEEQSIARS